MDALRDNAPDRPRFASPMPQPASAAGEIPSWSLGLTALGAFASLAFTTLLYLNNR